MTSENAMLFFTIDFESAICKYSDIGVIQIFEMVYRTNKIKYDKLVAAATAEYDPIQNYNMVEEGEDVRTPELTNKIESDRTNTLTLDRTNTATIERTNTVTLDSTNTVTLDRTNTETLDTTTAMTDTRETSTQGTSKTNEKTKMNQTHMTSETPGFEETTIHSINPYDNAGMSEESKDIKTQSGNRNIQESYSGDANTTDTDVTGNSTTKNSGGTSTSNTGTNKQTETGTNTQTEEGTNTQNEEGTHTQTEKGTNTQSETGTSKQTETGTDTTKHTLTRKGNIGVTTSQQMLESEIGLAEKMNVFKVIEQDLAAKLFLQVWIS